MVGIKSYGVHIPFKRLKRQSIAEYWGTRPAEGGERTIANWDEDAITMAVAAGMNCLKARLSGDKDISGLLFASTSFPYKEKQTAAIIATSLDLPRNCLTADYGNSLRAASIVLKSAYESVSSGMADDVLITAADLRLGYPGGVLEQIIGDGGGAILVGSTDVIVSIDGYYGVYDYFMDFWRAEHDAFVQSWEDRFIHGKGYLRVMPEVVGGLLKRYGLSLKDFARVIYNAPDARRHAALARKIGASKELVADHLFDHVGNTGAATVILSLAAALDNASPGDRLLLANYGDGADAFILTVTEEIVKFHKRNRSIVKPQIERKAVLSSYAKYLAYRNLIQIQPVPRPESSYPTPPAMWRENKEKLAMYGAKCRQCGTVQYPARRVCIKCKTRDDFERINLSGSSGKIFTFSIDNLAANVDRPGIYVVVDLDKGGRIQQWLTDCDEIEKVKIGMAIEMTFRREQIAGGIYHYGWKPRPISQ